MTSLYARLDLIDWRRRVAALYASVRRLDEPVEVRHARFWAGRDALFLPFRDGTSGHATYGGGRYLIDTAKHADLGEETGPAGERRLVLDFNFAYHPSCVYSPRWDCPLAPPENRLEAPIQAGEALSDAYDT